MGNLKNSLFCKKRERKRHSSCTLVYKHPSRIPGWWCWKSCWPAPTEAMWSICCLATTALGLLHALLLSRATVTEGCGDSVFSRSLALESLLESLPLPLLLYICCTSWRWLRELLVVRWAPAVALIPSMSSMEWLPVGDLLLSLSLIVITKHSLLILQMPIISTDAKC